MSRQADRWGALVWSWLPEIVLAASLVILFHRLFLGEVIFWGTPLLQFYPWREMAFDQIRAGQLPLWNPMLGNGAPLLANYQTAVFYPPNWLYLIIPTEYAMGWVGVLHLLWAGLGMAVYLRSLGANRLGQGISALAFALSGYLIARFGFLTITSVAPWLPWLIWAVDGVMSNQAHQGRSIGVLAGIDAMMLLAGHAQTAFYCLALSVVYGMWRTFGICHRREAWRRLAMAFGSALLGIGIASIQLLPTFELLQTSQRAGGLEREFAMTYSFWPWRFLSLLSPNFFGSPADGTYRGYANYWEDAIYIGLLPLVLAGRSPGRWWAERRAGALSATAQIVPFYSALMIPIFVLALGKNTPVFPWLYDFVPGFSLFQAPTRLTLLAVFGLAVLAGVGADQWQITSSGLAWSRRWIAAGLSILLSALYGWLVIPNLLEELLIRGAARLGIMVMLVATLALALRGVEWQPQWRPWWESGALILVAGDLVTAHWGLNPTINSSYYHTPSALSIQLSNETAGTRTLYFPEDEYRAKFVHFFNFRSFQAGDTAHWVRVRDSLLPNQGATYGVPSANNFDPLMVGSYDALLQSFDGLGVAEQISAAQSMNVGVLLTAERRSDLEQIGYAEPIYAYSLPGPWPRVSVADCEIIQLEARCAPSGKGRAAITDEQAQRIVVRISADDDSSLLLLDTYYPGWEARVDGHLVETGRANGAFRAVEIQQGEHEVVFEYRPASVQWGAGVTAISLMIGTALWLGSHRRCAKYG